MIWNSKTLSQALGIPVAPGIQAGKLQFNSKDVEKGNLFIALAGGQTDGHNYAKSAIENSAAAVIVSKDIPDISPDKIIKVDDTAVALLKLAQYKRRNSKAIFIGITGSTGKTSTKEALATMLESFSGNIFKSRGNFNNYLGAQVNLASMPDDTNYAVFEMGMNHTNEIAELSHLAKPDIAIITNISEAHIEFFHDINGIIEAKCEIFNGMHKDGIAVIPNYDEIECQKIRGLAEQAGIKNIYSFGKEGSDSCLLDYNIRNNETHLKYEINSTLLQTSVPAILPKFQCQNLAACLMSIAALNLDIARLVKTFDKIELMYGRGKTIKLNKGNQHYHIICDHYNASPASMIASLEHFGKINGYSNKILIIGDMLELGKKTIELHQKLVPYIIATNADQVVLVGQYMQNIMNYIPKSIKSYHFNETKELVAVLPSILNNDSLILIKASKRIGFEKILDYFDQ